VTKLRGLFSLGMFPVPGLKYISLFQGLCVAVLFCFCNGEVSPYDYGNSRFCLRVSQPSCHIMIFSRQVIAQFKRKWDGSALMRKRANSCTATTVSVCNIDEKYQSDQIDLLRSATAFCFFSSPIRQCTLRNNSRRKSG